MWLSNTATTAMMIPIVQAVLAEFNKHRKGRRKLKDQAESERHQFTPYIRTWDTISAHGL